MAWFIDGSQNGDSPETWLDVKSDGPCRIDRKQPKQAVTTKLNAKHELIPRFSLPDAGPNQPKEIAGSYCVQGGGANECRSS